MEEEARKATALSGYRAKLLQHKARSGGRVARAAVRGAEWFRALQELDAKVRTLREEVKKSRKEFDKTEDDLKSLQSVGQIIGEVLRQLDADRCAWRRFCVARAR